VTDRHIVFDSRQELMICCDYSARSDTAFIKFREHLLKQQLFCKIIALPVISELKVGDITSDRRERYTT